MPTDGHTVMTLVGLASQDRCFLVTATAPGAVEDLGLFGKRRTSIRRSARSARSAKVHMRTVATLESKGRDSNGDSKC